MRRQFLAAIAIACMLSTTGCFTLIGGVIGSVSEGPKKPLPPPEPPPQLRGVRPGSTYFSSCYAKQWQKGHEYEEGMSPGAKGMLIGAGIDVLLLAGFIYALNDFEENWGRSD